MLRLHISIRAFIILIDTNAVKKKSKHGSGKLHKSAGR